MDGILPLWKPKGITSHDCVFKVRKMLRMKKVGHTGTLDPEVDGVLPICLGRATKIASYITDAGKIYEGEVTLGFSTTTEDATGDIVKKKAVEHVFTIEEIKNVLSSFKGEITQTPPMFSAVKVNGKRLYEYARAGIEIKRPSRNVKIYSIELISDQIEYEDETIKFRFRVSCSKGTYIRTLAVMIGETLGYPSHMSQLTRIASAEFKAKDCITLEQLDLAIKNGEIKDIIYPLEKGISHLPFYPIDDNLSIKIKNGAVLDKPLDWPSEGHVTMSYQDHAYAIYEIHPEKPNSIKPVKVLITSSPGA